MAAVGYTGGDPNKVNTKGYTKGALLVADSTGTLLPLAVGSDTDVLTANSAAGTQGIDWEVSSGGGGGGGVPTGRRINTSAPLGGGGTLASDLTLVVASASATGVGVVQLAGDLAGPATAPTVPGLTAKANQTDLITLSMSVTGQSAVLAMKANQVDLVTVSMAVTGQAATLATKANQIDLITTAIAVTGQAATLATKANQIDLVTVSMAVTGQAVVLATKANQIDLIATSIAVTGQGAVLATKAADASVVHLAGSELITGFKTFGHAVTGYAEDPETIIFARNTVALSGADMFRFITGGRRTGYANEGGELRSRAYNENRVAFRCQSYVVGDGTIIDIFEATLSDNTIMFYVNALGDAGHTRDLTVGRNLIVTGTATVAGSSVVKLSDYSAYTSVTGFGTNVAASTPVPQVRSQPGSVTRMRGAISASGAGATGTLMTIPLAFAPLQAMTVSLRSTGTGAANLVIVINTNGTVTTGGTLPAGGFLAFDGVTFDRV